MYWIPWLLSRVWRGWLWEEGAEKLERLSAELETAVEPVWMGWRVGGYRVRGGVSGVRTVLRRDSGEKRVENGWVDVDDAMGWLRSD